MTRLRAAPRFRHKGASTSILLVALVSVVIVALVASALMVPSLTSSTPTNTNPGAKTNGDRATTTSSTSTSGTQTQPKSPTSVSCITVVPYDGIGKEFAGCGYTFSVLYNGAPGPLQTLPNGTEEINLGWTLLIQVSQNCHCGPNENVTVGWDPAGPGSSTSGERLPVPASTTLMNGNLTLEWRLYGSTIPLLYAWIIGSSLTSSSQQTTSTSTTPASCSTTSWPSQVSTSYQSVVQQIEQDPAFIALTDGLCYSFTLNYSGESGGQALATFVFNQYNGTIYYPCGTFPANLTISQVQVTVFNGTTTNEISSMWLDNQTASLNVNAGCGPTSPPVIVRSVLIVPPYTPAGPTVQVTLYAPFEQPPITNLTAVLALTGREPFQSQTQTFEFLDVNPSNPLLAGQSASQSETIIGPVTIYSNYIYSMNISGTFQNGQRFSYPAEVEIQNSPSSGGGPQQSSPVSRLKEVPDSASITAFGNLTFAGYLVTYANGTQSSFSLDSCPVPVSSSVYAVVSSIESNPRFVTAENGSAYEVLPNGQAGMSNGSGSHSEYMYYLYSSQKIYPCGGDSRTYTRIGAIDVTIPINAGSLEASRLQVQMIPASELDIFTCPTLTAFATAGQPG